MKEEIVYIDDLIKVGDILHLGYERHIILGVEVKYSHRLYDYGDGQKHEKLILYVPGEAWAKDPDGILLVKKEQSYTLDSSLPLKEAIVKALGTDKILRPKYEDVF